MKEFDCFSFDNLFYSRSVLQLGIHLKCNVFASIFSPGPYNMQLNWTKSVYCLL